MSEQTTLFKLPYNRFLMQRMEFVVICGDHLAANILRVIEAEMIKRKDAWEKRAEKAIEEKKPLPRKPKTWWVRLSQAQIIARLYMYDSAKLKKPESEDLDSSEWVEYRHKKALSISKATLKKAIELLKALGFLIERSQPGDEFGAPIYVLEEKNVQSAIENLPADPFTIFYHLGGVENFESGGESKNFTVPPENSDSGDSKNSDVPGEKFESGESQIFRLDIDSNRDSLEDTEKDDEREATLPAHEQNGGDSSSALAPPTHTFVPKEDVPPVHNRTENNSQLSTIPPSSPQGNGKVNSENPPQSTKDDLPGAAPIALIPMPPPDAVWKTTTCLLMFTHWRGKPLITRRQNADASSCAKKLAELYTREQVERVRTYMVEDDPWWSQHPEKVDVCTVAEHIHTKLAEMARSKKPLKKPIQTPLLPSFSGVSDEAFYAAKRRPRA